MGRAISETFKTDLLNGKLAGLLEAVKNDNTLIMELRGNQVIIYYRGGALYTISFDNGKYTIAYNKAYWRKKKLYDELVENPSIDSAVKYIALYKHQMDYHRANADRELEKQGQQQLILENNVYGGKILEDSNTSKIPTGDYFIVDMEYAYKGDDMDARFDLIALKWPSLSPARKKRKNLGISFLELKYYDGSMCGQSGIEKHISDFLKFTTDEKYKAIYHEMCRDMALVFKQKCELGLIPAYTSRLNLTKNNYTDITIDPENVEMIFVFINRDPDSGIAAREIDKCIKKFGKDNFSNIYVGTSSDMGYLMFRYEDNGKTDRYIPITEYIKKYGYEN